MIIKYATKEDIAAITAVEAECFPPAEAATEKEFIDRVKYYGNHFWLMYEAEKLIAFVDGFVTDVLRHLHGTLFGVARAYQDGEQLGIA